MNDFENHARAVLASLVEVLFPAAGDPSVLARQHAWRDRRYVGEFAGSVVAWRGTSVNLAEIDYWYRAVFIDLVDNVLPAEERVRLFGYEFFQATYDLPQFVCLFVLDFPPDSADQIIAYGYVPRRMMRSIHACLIASPEQFLFESALSWAARLVRLVILQRFLSTHRKPIDATEVPLQNLLYSSGYLHRYIVQSGLELHGVSSPRRAGEFGHDLQALVRNPIFPTAKPVSVGIEVYMGSLGHHAETIPEYANRFDLAGLVVVSKDDPYSALHQVARRFARPLSSGRRLVDIGANHSVVINHLPLQQVVVELSDLRDHLDQVLPSQLEARYSVDL